MRFRWGPQRRLRLFARMGRGGAMERFISACRNPLAKSATTKAIGYATQVPNASAKVLLFWHLANSCPGIENGMSGPLLQRIRFPFANRRRETQKNTSVKNTKFCKYEVETIAGTRRLQNQSPRTGFFIGPLRGKNSSPFAAYVSIFSP